MPSFKKLAKGYRASIYIGVDPLTGKAIRTNRIVRTKKEGNILEERLRFEFENDALKLRNKRYRYSEVYEMWLDEYADTVKDSTYMKTKGIFKLHILPLYGDRYIETIKPMELQKTVNQWAKKYVKAPDMFSYLALIFKYAERLEIIELFLNMQSY